MRKQLIKKMAMGTCIFAVGALLTLDMKGGSNLSSIGEQSAVTVYYDNYDWLYKFRDKNTIYGEYSTQTRNENTRVICRKTNRTSRTISCKYSVEERSGHSVNLKAGVNAKYFSAEAGYAFTKEKTVTDENNYKVRSMRSVTIKQSDIRDYYTGFNVEVTKQQFYWGKNGAKYYDEYSWWEKQKQYVKHYSGADVEFIEKKVKK